MRQAVAVEDIKEATELKYVGGVWWDLVGVVALITASLLVLGCRYWRAGAGISEPAAGTVMSLPCIMNKPS